MTADVELSEEMFIVTKETAEAYLKGRADAGIAYACLPTTDPTGSGVPPVAPPTTTSRRSCRRAHPVWLGLAKSRRKNG